MFGKYRLCLLIGIVLLLSGVCNSCDEKGDQYKNDSSSGDGVGDNFEPKVPLCSTPVKPFRVKGNINKHHTATLNDVPGGSSSSGYFASNSSTEKFRISINSCKTEMFFLLLTSLASSGDFVQANRDRYNKTMCTPEHFFGGKNTMLIGMAATNASSRYTAAYICPSKFMEKSTEQLMQCPDFKSYALSSRRVFEKLAEFLEATAVKAEQLMNNPGPELCTLFHKSQAETVGCKKFIKIKCSVQSSGHTV